MRMRMSAAILLSTLLSTVALSQTPAKDKEPAKGSEKSASSRGPEKVLEKTLPEWVKIATSDPDASARERALMVLTNFPGAELRKEASPLIKRINDEKDHGVLLAVIDLVAALGLEEKEQVNEAVRLLVLIASGNTGSVTRIHCLQALSTFGPKVHGRLTELTRSSDVATDRSYEARRAFAATLGRIGSTETSGPSQAAIQALIKLVQDPAFTVRLTALESLYILGPPFESGAKKPDATHPPQYDTKEANYVVSLMKARIAPTKSTTPPSTREKETNKQGEMWCRLVIMRFGVTGEQSDFDEQINAIARHLSDEDPTVRIQTLEVLGILRDRAESKIEKVAILVEQEKEPLVRKTGITTLGALGEKSGPILVRYIENQFNEPEFRIAALDALALLGEKAQVGREVLRKIINDPANLDNPTGVALVTHSLMALGSMGVKAVPVVPDLNNLAMRLEKILQDRLKSEQHIKLMSNPELKKMLAKLDEKDRQKFIDENQAENQLKKVVLETIRYIQESTEGHPGGEKKK